MLPDPIVSKRPIPTVAERLRRRRLGRINAAKHDLELRARKYKITGFDVEIKLKQQKGNCAICGLPPKSGELLHIDHCHITGLFRGLLHVKCNTQLAAVEDEIFRQQAIEYLERTSADKD